MTSILDVKKFELAVLKPIALNLDKHANEMERLMKLSDEALVQEYIFFSDYHHNQGDFDQFIVTAYFGLSQRFPKDSPVMLLADKLKDNYMYERLKWEKEQNPETYRHTFDLLDESEVSNTMQ